MASRRVSVSVVVPVYNAEQYLVQCVESLLNQSLRDCEIILVNDGSTDSSGEICESFACRDVRVRLITQRNCGLAAARDAGLIASVGEYVGFVDADDWVEPNMYERMFNVAVESDADIVWVNVLRNESVRLMPHMRGGVYGRSEIETIIFPRLLASLNERVSGCETLRWSNCIRIYRSSLLRKHNIRFDHRFRRCQDLPFTFLATVRANRYVYLADDYLYHNRTTPASLSRGYTDDMWGLVFPIIEFLAEEVKEIKAYDFSGQLCFRAFLFGVECVQNEAKRSNVKPLRCKIRTIARIINDPLIRQSLGGFSLRGVRTIHRLYYVAFLLKMPVLAYLTAVWRRGLA